MRGADCGRIDSPDWNTMSAGTLFFLRRAACVLLGALAASAPLEALAQCARGYYYASDGYCYPVPPPTYQPPAYDAAPPVSPPPAVMDGLMIGLGILIGGIVLSDHGDHHGHPEEHRAPPRHEPPPPPPREHRHGDEHDRGYH
jgi:hypothetical protein